MDDYNKRRLVRHLRAAVRHYNECRFRAQKNYLPTQMYDDAIVEAEAMIKQLRGEPVEVPAPASAQH